MRKNELGYTYNEVFTHIAKELDKNLKKLKYVGFAQDQDRRNTKS
jgi:hypothetical protein